MPGERANTGRILSTSSARGPYAASPHGLSQGTRSGSVSWAARRREQTGPLIAAHEKSPAAAGPFWNGSDGTRTRDLCRDRAAL